MINGELFPRRLNQQQMGINLTASLPGAVRVGLFPVRVYVYIVEIRFVMTHVCARARPGGRTCATGRCVKAGTTAMKMDNRGNVQHVRSRTSGPPYVSFTQPFQEHAVVKKLRSSCHDVVASCSIDGWKRDWRI